MRKDMDHIIDAYYTMPALNTMLKSFITAKLEEKTIWSQLTLLSHFMLGGDNPCIHKLAAVTELVVLGLDILDDLQDQDNPDLPWMKEPQELVLNAMTALLMASSAELGALNKQYPELPLPEAGELGRLISCAINGQHMDLLLTVETEDEYVEMVQQKSCILIRIAFYLGMAAIPNHYLTDEKRDQIYLLADYIGLIGQIHNDVSDLQRLDTKNDLFKKKRTLPILYLLSDPEASFVQLRQFFAGEITLEELLKVKQECLAYIGNSGCIEYSEMIGQLQLTRAKELLAQIPAASPWKEQLQDIALNVYGD
ncbi:polyprenyl synthetase family protein [Paenibacillus eucommiae]|uniref:Competence protein ComQ n=1 Tax=Paenibacillus eucommiae TaxID=1355755 RepID=A0ABS4J1S1_9BACL|nr:polyprenyl synthetase family protein [Paenibacillus eucommiae]MBP1993265.1 competence protein ComQ [Paenibacillus eucommiae]